MSLNLDPPTSIRLARAEIGYTGSCFYRDNFPSSTATGVQSQYFQQCWTEMDKENKLKILSEPKASPIRNGLHSDLIEMLYIVRNAAVHGELDYLDEKNNQTARTGLTLLNALIKNILRP